MPSLPSGMFGKLLVLWVVVDEILYEPRSETIARRVYLATYSSSSALPRALNASFRVPLLLLLPREQSGASLPHPMVFVANPLATSEIFLGFRGHICVVKVELEAPPSRWPRLAPCAPEEAFHPTVDGPVRSDRAYVQRLLPPGSRFPQKTRAHTCYYACPSMGYRFGISNSSCGDGCPSVWSPKRSRKLIFAAWHPPMSGLRPMVTSHASCTISSQ